MREPEPFTGPEIVATVLNRNSGTILVSTPVVINGEEVWPVTRAVDSFTMSHNVPNIDREHGQGSLFDSFYQINSFRPSRRFEEQVERGNVEKVREFYEVSGDYLTHLNAVWVDLDCYKEKIPVHIADAAVQSLIKSGVLPLPSIEVHSGRGVWYMFLIGDAEGNSPRATDDRKTDEGKRIEGTKTIATRINKRLSTALKVLGGDPNAVTLVRYTRFPGSLNRKTINPTNPDGTRVTYKVIQTDEGVPVYTLYHLDQLTKGKDFRSVPDQVKSFLREHGGKDVRRRLELRRGEPTTSTDTGREGRRRTESKRSAGQKDPVKQASGKKGFPRRFEKITTVIEFIAETRGGLPIGTRGNAILYYATACYHLGMLEETAVNKAARLPLQEEERDTFSRKDIERTVRHVYNRGEKGEDSIRPNRAPADETLSRLFEFTEEERATLYLSHNFTLRLPGEDGRDANKAVCRLKRTGKPLRMAILRTLLVELDSSPDGRPKREDLLTLWNDRLPAKEGPVCIRTLDTYLRELGEFEKSADTLPLSLTP